MSKQVSSLAKTIEFQAEVTKKVNDVISSITSFCALQVKNSYLLFSQTHEHKVQKRMKEIERLNKKTAKTAQKNNDLEQELAELQVTVSEMRHIDDTAGNQTVISHLIKQVAIGVSRPSPDYCLACLVFRFCGESGRHNRGQLPGDHSAEEMEGYHQSQGGRAGCSWVRTWASEDEELSFTGSAETQLSQNLLFHT